METRSSCPAGIPLMRSAAVPPTRPLDPHPRCVKTSQDEEANLLLRRLRLGLRRGVRTQAHRLGRLPFWPECHA